MSVVIHDGQTSNSSWIFPSVFSQGCNIPVLLKQSPEMLQRSTRHCWVGRCGRPSKNAVKVSPEATKHSKKCSWKKKKRQTPHSLLTQLLFWVGRLWYVFNPTLTHLFIYQTPNHLLRCQMQCILTMLLLGFLSSSAAFLTLTNSDSIWQHPADLAAR